MTARRWNVCGHAAVTIVGMGLAVLSTASSPINAEPVQATASPGKGVTIRLTKHLPLRAKPVTRADLSEIVYQRVGLSRTESAELVQSVLDEICDAAARGETVKLSGFGSFVVRSKGERVGRNPKTGVEVPILPRRVMVFKPSNVLKAKINGRDAGAEKE